jgi:hypothetical protein
MSVIIFLTMMIFYKDYVTTREYVLNLLTI